MNTNTGGNTANESAENIKKDSGNILSQLYKDFSEHIVKDLNPEDTNKEIENFITADSLSSSQLKYLEVFKGKYEKYDGVKVNEIELPGLKRELRSQFLKRKGLFQSVKKQILKKYNITSNQYSDFNIEGFIKSKNLKELTEIYSTSQKMDKFISNFCENKKIKVFEKKSVKNILKDISLKERYKEKMKDLSEEDITEISQSMTYLKQNIGQTDFGLQFSLHIDTLLSKKILNYTEVADIIKEFIPFISLEDALKINSNLDDKAIKKAQLNSLNDLNFDSLNSDTQDKIIKEIDDKDISIPVEYLFSTDNAIVKELVNKLINESFLIKIGDAIQEELSDFENIGGPQNYNSFIKGLKDQKTNVINPEKFITGNYIVLKTSINNKGSDEKEEKNSYFKILSDGSDKPFGNIILESKGEDKYSSNNSKNATFTYKDWIDFIEKGNSEKNIVVDSHGIYSEKEFKDRINNGNVLEDLETSEFKNPPSDLDAYKNNKENDKIKELLNKKPEYSKLKDNELRKKIYEFYPDFENEIDNEIIDWNRNYLITKLKEIDDSGDKFGFEKGTTISYEDGNETIYFTVENAENYDISIKHDNKNSEKMDYNTFYNAFKDKHAKRVNKVNNCTKLLDNIGEIESIKDKWSGVEISNSGDLIKKNTSDDEDSVLNYEYIECELPLFGECDVMKIHNISDNGVKVSYGKKTGHEKLKDKKAQEEKEEREKKEGKKILYNMGSDTQTIPLGVFQAYLEKKGGIPKSFEEENSPEIHNDPDSIKREGSFLSRFMQRASINDLIAGGKLVIDSIESKLKEGTDEQAAKMVSDLNWLPDSIKIDLDMRVEQASKKRMDEFKDRLGGMDSGKSTEMISKVLLNKDSPESMKEASIMFMAEKYGTLYEKSALHKYKGSFLRYEAFGGRIGDELYRRVEADCKSDGVNFTEHELMIGLLGNQCKGRLKPKRRSKLHKEYKAAMARGKKDEKEKGANDSNEKRTFEGRLYGVALNELKDGAYLNAIGALGPVIGKGDGGKFERLDMMPFVMMSSGDAYTYDQDVSNMIKGSFSPAGMALPSTFFCSSPDLIDLYNNTLLEATKILEADNPGKYSDMLNMVTTLLSGNKVVNNDALKTKKIDQAIELYKKYGDEISRIMNMLNTRKNDDVAKYEKLIWLEKDNNKVFKEYFNLFNSVAVGAECDFSKDDDTMADAFYSNEPGTGGYTGMGSKKVFRDTLAENTNGTYRMSKAGPQTEGELINQLEAFKKIDYDYGSASVDEIKNRKVTAVTDYLHGYFYAMKYHHNIVKHFPEIIKTKVPMKMLGVNAKDFENLTAMDFEKDKPEALAVSKKYAKIWLGIGNIQNDDSDIFENIPRSVSDILD